jgi:hypothetical protein
MRLPLFFIYLSEEIGQPRFYWRMSKAAHFLLQAERCERLAEQTTDEASRTFLRETAQHWLDLAHQMALLERLQVYRMIRDRPGP